MKPLITVAGIVAILAILIYLGGCNYNHVEAVRHDAPTRLEEMGFEVMAYEGYQIGNIFGQPGGVVWYVVRRKDNDSIRYECSVSQWGNELHVYSLKALDAIAPSNQ